jgi:hypothetical protein
MAGETGMADLSPPLNEDEIVSLLRFHVRAELALIEAGTATKETMLPHVQRIEQLYLLLPDVGVSALFALK